MASTLSTTRLRSADFRAFALREHYLYFKMLAYGVSPWLCVMLNALRVTPNQVTLAGIALVVPSVLLNLSGHLLMSIALFHLFFVFDATDGILARATGRKSRLGAYLDDMAHHMFHVPFLLSLAYAEYRDEQALLALAVAIFAVVNTLYRAHLDIIEKTGILNFSDLKVTAGNAAAATSGFGVVMKNIVLGSFDFPNALLWMTALLWNPVLMTAYFVYASIMTILYYFYLFSKITRSSTPS